MVSPRPSEGELMQPSVDLEDFPEVTDTFTHLCIICGATVSVVAGETQPHRCRIEIS